jgi:hypothetical protein
MAVANRRCGKNAKPPENLKKIQKGGFKAEVRVV